MRRRTNSGHYIGQEFPKQRELQENYSKLIRKIYNSDNLLTPRQQQKAVMLLSGLTIYEMYSIIKSRGPKLAQTIRRLISPYRAKKRNMMKNKRK